MWGDLSFSFKHSLSFFHLYIICSFPPFLLSNFTSSGSHLLFVHLFSLSSLFSLFNNCSVHPQVYPVDGCSRPCLLSLPSVWMVSLAPLLCFLSFLSLSLHWSYVAKESWQTSWEQRREGGKKGGEGGGPVQGKRIGLKGVPSCLQPSLTKKYLSSPPFCFWFLSLLVTSVICRFLSILVFLLFSQGSPHQVFLHLTVSPLSRFQSTVSACFNESVSYLACQV